MEIQTPEPMTLNQYQQRAMSTCTPSCNNFSYMMLNLVGEVGELSSKVAKAIRKEEAHIGGYTEARAGDCNLYFTFSEDYADMMEHIKLEAGDILWQLAGLCTVFGWEFEEVARMNLAKLASRHERGKIIGDGDDR